MSIIREAMRLAGLKDFKGYILDVRGPTANMYGIECNKKLKSGSCPNKRCTYPDYCRRMNINHKRQIELLKKLRQLPGVKKVFIGSGLRYDMVLEDKKYGVAYLKELVNHHISGQLKIAPEHITPRVLEYMGKPSKEYLQDFRLAFYWLNKEAGEKQFLTYYFIAAHPGCTEENMRELKEFIRREIKINVEQVQIFTPLPSTYSALMYYTRIDPFSGRQIFVERDIRKKERQKSTLVT